MKIIALSTFLSFQVIFSFGLTQYSNNYLLLIRNKDGKIIKNEKIDIVVNIREQDPSTIIYEEKISTTTNLLGDVEVKIGKGENPTGSFKNIQWGEKKYQLNFAIFKEDSYELITEFNESVTDSKEEQILKQTETNNKSVYDIKDFGADPTGKQDSYNAFNTILNILRKNKTGGIIYASNGSYLLNSTLYLPSNVVIEGGNSKLICNSRIGFILDSCSESVTLRNLIIEGRCKHGQICFAFMGSGNNINTHVQNIYVDNVRVHFFDLGVYAKNLRQSTFNRCQFIVRNGFIYTSKSSDVNIDNSLFISDERFPKEASIGLLCCNENKKCPEGLCVTNTLFYSFKKNLRIDDLLIGKFNSCLFDNGPSEPITITYNERTEGISFNNCWFYNKGFIFGEEGYANPKAFRSQINNSYFCNMSAGSSILLKGWCSDIFISDCIFISDNSNGEHIGINATHMNSRIELDNLHFQFYNTNYVRFINADRKNKVTNILNTDDLKDPIIHTGNQVFINNCQ